MNIHENVFYLNFITSYMTITIADNNKSLTAYRHAHMNNFYDVLK